MEKDRVLYFDILNIFACVCVIWLHCNSILYSYGQTPLCYVSLVVQVICHFAVPAFFPCAARWAEPSASEVSSSSGSLVRSSANTFSAAG